MDTQLRQLQLIQLEILKQIDQLCRKYSISYSLYAGTLLGAVRHQGFIPWDDDLDICMSRADYQRFLQAWEEVRPVGYILQNKENSPEFSQSFSKIRKNHTCFLETKWEIGRYHTGIYVDVFPIDRIPEGHLKRRLFQLRCVQYQLLTREYTPPEASMVQKVVAGIILGLSPKKDRPAQRQKLLKKIERFNCRDELQTVAIETYRSIQTPLPKDFMTVFTDLPFENSTFMCSAAWHEYLTAKFGEYLKLPPEKERTWRHHPLILDFNRNYEEIAEEERGAYLASAE